MDTSCLNVPLALELIENKTDSKSDILNIVGELLEALAQLKSDISVVDVACVLEKWTASFNEKFKAEINTCCVIKNPFDVDVPIPEENGEESLPTGLDDGDLLNESLNVYEGDYLANLSPGKRQSVAQTATEFNKRNSFMPASHDISTPFKLI